MPLEIPCLHVWLEVVDFRGIIHPFVTNGFQIDIWNEVAAYGIFSLKRCNPQF